MKRLLVSAGIIASLALGFAIGEYRVAASKLFQNTLNKVVSASSKALSSPDGLDLSRTNPLGRPLETVLIPIRVRKIDLHELFEFIPGRGGGICNFGDLIVIADREGGINAYSLNENKPVYTSIPNLSGNTENAKESDQIKIFEVHDIECITSSDGNYIVASHEYFDQAVNAKRLAISKFQFDYSNVDVNKSTWKIIFLSDNWQPLTEINNAGRLLYDDGGKIIVTIAPLQINNFDSEFIMDPQSLESQFGKILRVDINDGKSEVVSYGHRNVQGLVQTRLGEILATEHGPLGGDELNRIRQGFNYGYPIVTHGVQYGSYKWPFSNNAGRHSKFEKPIFSWVPSIAVSNLIEVKYFSDAWDGDLLLTTLKARSLFRLRYQNGKVLFAERIWIGDRMRDITTTESSGIVILAENGQLIILTLDLDSLASNKRTGKDIEARLATAYENFVKTNQQ
jgi:aldose sugar dehydrogenase